MSINRNNKTWGELNGVPVTFNGKALPAKKTKKQPVIYLNKQNYLHRFCKAVGLYFTSLSSWEASWHRAAK